MTAISPEAQALVDRLHAVDLARPKLGSEAVENAFNGHLEALGLPLRPICAMRDASSAYRHMIDLADATSRLDAMRAAREAPLDVVQPHTGRSQRRAWSHPPDLPGGESGLELGQATSDSRT